MILIAPWDFEWNTLEGEILKWKYVSEMLGLGLILWD